MRARFKENLKPGRTYQVVVKTVSGSVASWPATGNVTTRPLPVQDTIQAIVDEQTQETLVVWRPNPDSFQDGYKVRKLILRNYFLMKENLLKCIENKTLIKKIRLDNLIKKYKIDFTRFNIMSTLTEFHSIIA